MADDSNGGFRPPLHTRGESSIYTDEAPVVDWQKRARGQERRKNVGKAMQSAGKSLVDTSTRSLQDQAAAAAMRTIDQPQAPRYMDVPSFKRGGTMRKSGTARLHKGEQIVSKKRGRKGRGRSR